MNTAMKMSIGAAALVATAGFATAQNALLTFGYTDLAASYNSNGSTGVFQARATNETSGDVTQHNPNADTAVFAPGFTNQGLADAVFTMNISNITDNTADAMGSLTLTDVNGDRVRAWFSGTWTRLSPGPFTAVAFQGEISVLQFETDGDGVFEGWNPDSDGENGFTMADGLPFAGALVEVGFAPESFFDESFSGYETEVSATARQVPAPVAGLLAGVPGLALASRRRRG